VVSKCPFCQKSVETTPTAKSVRTVNPVHIDRRNLIRSAYEVTYAKVNAEQCNWCGYVGDDFKEIEKEDDEEKSS